jgi:hypothetical protein
LYHKKRKFLHNITLDSSYRTLYKFDSDISRHFSTRLLNKGVRIIYENPYRIPSLVNVIEQADCRQF